MKRPLRPSSSSRRPGSLALAASLGLLCLWCGCAQHYAITTTNGGTIFCEGRPKLERGYYVYQDADGQEQRINELRVREIAVQ